MKHQSSVQDLLFDVDQVPVEAVISSNGRTRRISIPGKKALVNQRTGLVLGVVSRDSGMGGRWNQSSNSRKQLIGDPCYRIHPRL